MEKKKIGILTLVFNNFGTKLQSFALAKVLQNAGYDVEVINCPVVWEHNTKIYKRLLNHRPECSLKDYVFHCYYTIKYCILNRFIDLQNETVSKLSTSRKRLYAEFNKSYIPYSPETYTPEDLRNGAISCKYDVVICGSDQIWNGEFIRDVDIFFLDFLRTFSVKKISYAASFGSKPLTNALPYRDLFNNFDAVSVREDSGLSIVKGMGRDDAVEVLDPTLILPISEYYNIMSSQVGDLETDGFVLIYSLNYSTKIFSEARKLAKRERKKLVVLKRSFCPPRAKGEDIELFAVSIGDFLWLINNAFCIVTNSFHAVVFSCIFQKNFYCFLDKEEDENERIYTLLRNANITDRVYYETQHLPDTVVPHDYEKGMDRMEEARSRSLDFLFGSLSS